MGAERQVRRYRLLHQIGALTLVARIFVRPKVSIGPTVEATRLNVRQKVGYQVISQAIPLLNGGPKRIRARVEIDGSRVSKTGSVDIASRSVGIAFPDRG